MFLGLAASLVAMAVIGLVATMQGLGLLSVARQVDNYLMELLARSQLSGYDEFPHVQASRPVAPARAPRQRDAGPTCWRSAGAP